MSALAPDSGQCTCDKATLRVSAANHAVSCSDFADTYPNCEVIGTDISPIQPGWVPPNLKLYA